VLVRWQALQAAVRGSGAWAAQLEAAPVGDLAALLSASHEQLARMRYLAATGRRDEAALGDAMRMDTGAFTRAFPGFMDWIRCGG
jgi:hypothetical protein